MISWHPGKRVERKLMYVEINAVKKELGGVTLKVTDIDALTLCDWDTELASIDAVHEFFFDLDQSGPRAYIYKIIKSKGEGNTLQEMLNSLVGKTLFLNNSFRSDK